MQAVPTHSVLKLVTMIKSITAREVFERCPEVEEQLCVGEFWTDAYYVATVGERGSWDIVERYSRKQGDEPAAVQLKLL